jgi:hypothetical protein
MAAKRTKGNTRASRQRIFAAERHVRAIELRKAGVTFQQIADQLGYANAAGAHKAVTTALREMLREPTEELRALEVARLDHMLLGIWQKATSGGTWEIDRALKIMERRAALLGLDAPKRIENTGKDGAAIAISLEGAPNFSNLTPIEQFELDQLLAKVIESGGELSPAEEEVEA